MLTVLAAYRESLTEARLAKIHELFDDPKNLRTALDQYYARNAVAGVPGTFIEIVGIKR